MASGQEYKAENLLIIGATGWIGKYILDELIKSKKFKRLAIFTSENTVKSKASQIEYFKTQGVEIITGDVTNSDDISRVFQDRFDTVISAVGRQVLAQQIEWIRIAASTPNIKRFLPSEYGTDIEHGPKSATEIPHQQKLKVRAYLRSLKDSLDYTYVVTGPFADVPGYLCNTEGRGQPAEVGSWDVKKKQAILIGTGNTKIGLTTNRDVGRFVVAALLHPEASRNRALKVNSFITTPSEILSEFEKQTGGEKWSVSNISLEKLIELEQQAWKDGNPLAALYTLRRIWSEGGTATEGRDNAAIGVTETDSLGKAVGDAIQAQLEGAPKL